MATNYFQPAAPLVLPDLGAAYEQARNAREQREQAKLDYINQFEKARGPMTAGVRQGLDSKYQAFQDLLNDGDLSFEHRKRIDAAWQDYANSAADGVEFSSNLRDMQATVMSDPYAYNDPSGLYRSLTDLENMPVRPGEYQMLAGQLPNINMMRRFAPMSTSPVDVASQYYNNLKNSGGWMNWYDTKTGLLNPDKAKAGIMNWIKVNGGQNMDMYKQMIAEGARLAGDISNSIEDISLLDNLAEEDVARYLDLFAQNSSDYLVGQLLPEDIETADEQFNRQKRLANYQASIRDKQSAPRMYNIFAGDQGSYNLRGPATIGENGMLQSEGTVSSSKTMMYAPILDSKPSFNDAETGRQYTVQNLVIDENGQPGLDVSYSQKYKNKNGDMVTTYAREIIPATPQILSSLSNSTTAGVIRNTFTQMLGMTGGYSENQPANQPAPEGQMSPNQEAFLDGMYNAPITRMEEVDEEVVTEQPIRGGAARGFPVAPQNTSTSVFGRKPTSVYEAQQQMFGQPTKPRQSGSGPRRIGQ